jgi:hypothetical protein
MRYEGQTAPIGLQGYASRAKLLSITVSESPMRFSEVVGDRGRLLQLSLALMWNTSRILGWNLGTGNEIIRRATVGCGIGAELPW